ncbi:MAG: hypothetical protein Q8K74_12640 [Candidatus Nitrotoga sp.]|nr:hypothetical protein [Candidatus Nitrotoga sp.]MDP1856861.1 hypothetical protein [Candidatus Nitrotoga sp.]
MNRVNIERVLWICLLVGSFSISFFNQHKLGQTQSELDRTKSELINTKNDLATEIKRNQNPKDLIEAFLRDDLMKRNELIPCKGVQGGVMAIHSPDQIQFQEPNRVLVQADDGHVDSNVLFEYSIRGGGKIAWKVVTYECDGF